MCPKSPIKNMKKISHVQFLAINLTLDYGFIFTEKIPYI